MSELIDKDGLDKERPGKELPDEQQLDEYLRGGSAVSRQYRQLPNADVPAELDRLVLRQAQEAVKPRPAKSRTWMRWTAPLALAASAVLVVSIVIESGVHKDTYLAVPVSAPVEMMKQEAAEQPTAASAPERMAVEADDARHGAVAGSAGDAGAYVAPDVNPYAVRGQPPAAADMRSAAPPVLLLPEEPAPTRAPQFASAPRDVSADEAPAELARREQANAVPQSRVTTTPAPAPVAAEARVRETEAALEEVVMTGAKRREQKRAAGPRNTVVPATAEPASSAAEQEEHEQRNYSDPEQWLSDIRELRKAKKHEQADREWRRFRYVFPNYRVAENDLARGVQR